MRRLLVVVVALLAVPGSAAAGGGGGMSLCAGFATGSEVSMLDSCFDGTAHFAPAGETLTIVNDGSLPHTFTAVDGSFDTGQLAGGESYEITVDEPGIIEVFCTLHGTAEGTGMAGVLVVGEAEPLPVSATADMSVIQEAVAEESQPLADALGNQSQMIAALTNAQATLTDAVEAQGGGEIPAQPGWGSRAEPWMVGLAGAAVAAGVISLTTALAVRRRLDLTSDREASHASIEA